MRVTKQIKREARQLFRLCHRQGMLDESRTQMLLQRIVRAKPRGALSVLGEFERMLKREYAQRAATVETVVPLASEAAARLQTRLESAYGPGLSVSFQRNPALIGGVRVTVGSDVYDGSIQGRLAALEARFA